MSLEHAPGRGEASDWLWGARAIGNHINASPRKVFYLLEHGLIPGKRVGSQWVSSKRELDACLRGKAAERATPKPEIA